VDFDYCQKKGINAKLCLGLPGKYAPKSSAGILLEVIGKTILGEM
jgi:dipicolinate synthase subunit A